jgi:hypothetical protein
MQINKLSYGLDPNFVEPAQITMKVVQGCHNNVTTVELDVSHYTLQGSGLILEPRRRDCCLPHNQAPRLRHSRCSNRHLQLAQRDPKVVLSSRRQLVPMGQPQDWQARPYDL